jgi:hypothetical protein
MRRKCSLRFKKPLFEKDVLSIHYSGDYSTYGFNRLVGPTRAFRFVSASRYAASKR